ncbi:MAG: sulfurtransferase [Steroidobacteraceae bacterium]|nr:sulfurtransferase [Steroidobacteraceae bacterium]MDW8260398.1 sulfurtransferase [Gammaproteobacteria bacterium]
MYTTLIDCESLLAHLGRRDWLVIDCRFDLARPHWGGAAYWQGHIPGALYAHLDRDLSAPVTPTSGRHPLPAPQLLARRFGAWGIGRRTQVVAYDQGNGMVAARLWWLLRWLGHSAVAVLDGGFEAWRAEAGAILSRDVVPVVDAEFLPDLQPDWVVTTAMLEREVAEGLPPGRLFDARAPDRFAGRNETIDPVAGHVPGAVNAPFTENLAADGRWLDRATLRERWLERLQGRAPGATIMMCGSGVSACHNLLALEHAALGGARLYAGSWSEWIRDPKRPILRTP